jgi:DNA-binding transcriptional MerR regulator
MFRIGDFSRLSHVSIKALRYYDEVGLLKPTFVDGATGYRYYSADLLSRLNRILVFKDLGFSLDEIAMLLQEGLPAGKLREALASRREYLSTRIAEEQNRLARVAAWLMQIDLERSDGTWQIKVRHLAPRLVAAIRENVGSYDEAAVLFSELERHLKRHNASGQQGAVWHSCAGQADGIDCEAIALLNRPVPSSNRVLVYEIPSGLNACLTHHGSDESVADAYLAAHSWITKNGYAITGPPCEVYWQGGVAHDDGPGVTEIRYPILESRDFTFAGH